VDDGSTDDTYEEARRYESDTVTVVSKENGGKYSALNYGLLFTETEIIVTVDADSIVETDALRDIVARSRRIPRSVRSPATSKYSTGTRS